MKHFRLSAILAIVLSLACGSAAWGQEDARGSRNIRVAGHLLIDGGTAALAVEQAPDRPYAYLATRGEQGGFVALDLTDIASPTSVALWPLAETEGRDLTLFARQGRHYLVQATSSGAVVVDVTGMPDDSRLQEAARIPEERGFRGLFAYRHSDGRALLLATGGGQVFVYDLAGVLNGTGGLVTTFDTPEQLDATTSGFDVVFAGYEPDSGQDRLYGAGGGGYYIYDFSDPAGVRLLVSISSAAVQRGRAIAPTPDGRYVVTAAGYRTAPLRIFDLQAALDGDPPRIRTAVGAWTSDWRNDYTDLQVRWPFLFAAALENGVQVVNIHDPSNPYTDAYYRTTPGEPDAGLSAPPRGIFRVAVRNHDGLIVASDLDTGFWAFYLEAFSGWHGHAWGMPHMSGAQDWENGPDGK